MKTSPTPLAKRQEKRIAFTVIEMVAAFALMAVVLVLVAKAGFTSMKERGRSLARQTALEHVHNILETARALSWEKLTPEWAATLKLPEDWIYVLPEAQLHVKVDPEKTSPHLKRVTVHLRWLNADGYPVEEQLVGLFAARSAALKEEKE